MTTYEQIKLMIEQEVRADIHGDLYGHERVAEALAERIDAQAAVIARLKAEIDSLEAITRWDESAY